MKPVWPARGFKGHDLSADSSFAPVINVNFQGIQGIVSKQKPERVLMIWEDREVQG